MTAKRIQTSRVTGSLITMLLLPAGVVLAQNRSTPGSEFNILAFWDPPSLSPGQAKAASSSQAWFRNTFVLFRTEETLPVDPADGSASTAEPAKAPAAVPDVQLPGTVQNLRRADKH